MGKGSFAMLFFLRDSPWRYRVPFKACWWCVHCLLSSLYIRVPLVPGGPFRDEVKKNTKLLLFPLKNPFVQILRAAELMAEMVEGLITPTPSISRWCRMAVAMITISSGGTGILKITQHFIIHSHVCNS